MLKQPIEDHIKGAKRFLLAGCGGGYDVFGAIPLLVEFLDAGKEVHLANLSFCYLNGLSGAMQHPKHPNLYAVLAKTATEKVYCPEAWLARWLEERLGKQQPVWGFEKTGVRPLQAAYEYLIDALSIDCIILFDGGIDALLRGDETSLGTPSEDLVSLAAVYALEGPTKLLACVGLGAELRDGIRHAQVLRRIAELTREGAFLGSTALLPSTRAGALYDEAVEFVFSHQKEQRQSHVHRVIRAAMRGEVGEQGPHIWLSPLLNMYWFFSLPEVAKTHLFLPHLLPTQSIGEVSALIEGLRKTMVIKEKESLPL